MGRLKKYKTAEEKAEMHRQASKKYYWENKDEQDKKQAKRNQSKRKNN